MEGVVREVQRCPPGVHRVHSPKRYASEDSEGRPAAILSYQFQSRVNRMFPHALTEAGLCAICHSKSDGIVWCPSGPVSCISCGYEFSNPSERESSVSPDSSDVPSGLLVSSEGCSDHDQREELASINERSVLDGEITASGGNAPARGVTADQTGTSGTLGVSTRTVWFSVPAGEGDALACENLASGGNASASELAGGGDAPASESSVVTTEPHRHQRRSMFCGSRAMGGIDFDGSPISETDEEDPTDPVSPVTEYHQIWDHDDPPLEDEVVDRSELPPGYRFASSLTREELRIRYRFRGNGINLHSAGAEFAYIQSDTLSDHVAEEAAPARSETWPNGNPMWATDPSSPIQLRMPPVPDPYRVLASLADSPEEVPDVPSVAQLRALWENQFAATTSPFESVGNRVYYNQHSFSSKVRSGNQDERSADVTHYVDDVAPFPRARTRPPFVDNSEEESDGEPRSLSGSSTQHYADDVLTHDDDRSSSHVTESTVEANLDAEFYKQEGDRLIEIINVQRDAVAKSESEAKALAGVVNAQRANIEEMTDMNKAIAEFHKAQIEQRERQAEHMHDSLEESRKVNADLATRFAQLMVDTSHLWGPASQTFSTDVVLPEWSVDVAIFVFGRIFKRYSTRQ